MQTNDLPTVSFEPLNGFILVLPKKQETEKKVGSILLAGYESSFATGIVISIGRGRQLESGYNMKIEVLRGDTVYYSPDSALDHRIDGELYHLVPYERFIGYVMNKREV